MKRKAIVVFAVALAALLLAPAAEAAITGKITGTVIDKKSKEPLLGVPVQVLGTGLGAFSQPDGSYLILNVPPGTHTLKVEMIGYKHVEISDVHVTPDQTTTINVSLEEDILELDEVVRVVAERPIIVMDDASTKRTFDAKQIEQMPVTTVEDILTKDVGVTRRGNQIHVRGGRANEILYQVDGVSMKDPLGGRGPTESMNLTGSEIENVAIIKGGWDAEYGEATSGIINVTTKEGRSDVTRGRLEYYTDDFGTRSLNTYSFNYDRAAFNLGGPEPLFSKHILPALGIMEPSSDLTFFFNADFDKTDTYTPYSRYTSPSRRMQHRKTEFLFFDISDRQENIANMSLKLTYRITPSMRLSGKLGSSWERSQPFTGRNGWTFRYTPNTLGWIEDVNTTQMLRFNHQLSKNAYYQVVFSRFHRDYKQKPGDPTTPGGTLRPDQFLQFHEWERYQDVNGNGQWDAPEPFENTYPDTAIFRGTRTPQYNYGDIYIDKNFNGRFDHGDSLVYDFNNNGNYDIDSGEPFEDVNGNGVFDAGERFFNDSNNNGRFDQERASVINQDRPEPFIDGDIVEGEPFTDLNRNGVRDEIFEGDTKGEPYEDLSLNSRYDGPNDPWVPGVPFKDLNENGIYDAPNQKYDTNEPFIDKNGNGQWDPADGFWDFGYNQWALYTERDVTVTTLQADITSQMRKEHEIKAGLLYRDQDLSMGELQYPYYPYDNFDDGGPFPGIGVFRDFYTRSPKHGAIYIRDKMEYGQMIANIGFRYDFFVQSEGVDAALEQQGTEKPVDDFRSRFSPRIAFSYPISDKAKVFFNYGHFYQMPELTYMYRRATQASNAFGIIGNANIDYKKTIQYEFGIQYLLSETYVASVQGFYKDDFGLVNTTTETNGPVTNNVYENHDYARARGLELELDKKYGNYVSGKMSYAYSFAFGKSSSESSNYYDDFFNRSIPIQEFPLNWDVRHRVTLNLDLRVSRGDHPKLFGLTMPDDWGVNFLWQFGSGYPYTPDRLHPGTADKLVPGEDPLPNSERMPSTSNLDIRFNKDFRLWKLNYSFQIWVNNVFDTRNVDGVSSLTGRADTSQNPNGIVFEGQEIDRNPRNWLPGRNIRLGLAVNF